jgi:hypothetical protein
MPTLPVVPEQVQRTPDMLERYIETLSHQSPAQSSPAPSPTPSLASSPALSPAQTTVQRTSENAPFRHINRYRDPRVLARAVEPNSSSLQSELALTGNESTAVLPQARVASAMPLASATIQRTLANVKEERAVEFPMTQRMDAPVVGQVAEASPALQRSPEQKSKREKNAGRKSLRVQPPSARASSVVRRSALPLAKLRTAPHEQVAQRDVDDVDNAFVGASAANSARARVQTENFGGTDVAGRNGIIQRSADQQTAPGAPVQTEQRQKADDDAPDLDRLARAILPVIKRMLAIERDRRNPRPPL